MPDHPDQSHVFGGGASASTLNPIVLVAMLVVVVLIVFLRRKYVIVPVLLFTFLVPLGQQVYLLGVHWLALRIIILAGCVRLARHKFSSKSPLIAGGFNSVDQAFLVCVLCEAACMILRYMQYQALIYQFGVLIDYLGAYFLLRYLIQDREDIFRAIKCLALLSLILALFMVREQLTLQNAFGSLGGVRLTPEIRGDKIRSQAVFQHSLTAGCFAATLLPLFFLLWKNGKAKLIAGIGVVGSTVMTLTAHSSTPALAYVAGILGVCFWPVRKQMRLIRWGLVIAILAQAIVMKAPVWFVLNHIDLTGSSSGYHRAELIDEFVRHFPIGGCLVQTMQGPGELICGTCRTNMSTRANPAVWWHSFSLSLSSVVVTSGLEPLESCSVNERQMSGWFGIWAQHYLLSLRHFLARTTLISRS